MVLHPLHKNHFSKVTQPQFQPESLGSKSTSSRGENENWKQESPSLSLLLCPVQCRTVMTAPDKAGQVSRDARPLMNFVTAIAHGIRETKPLSRLQECAVQNREVQHSSTFRHHRKEPSIYEAINRMSQALCSPLYRRNDARCNWKGRSETWKWKLEALRERGWMNRRDRKKQNFPTAWSSWGKFIKDGGQFLDFKGLRKKWGAGSGG